MTQRERFFENFLQANSRNPEWLRRVTVLGSTHPNAERLCADLAQALADRLSLPVIQDFSGNPVRDIASVPSVIACSIDGIRSLDRCVRLSTSGHMVVAKSEVNTVVDLFEMIGDHPEGVAGASRVLSRISFMIALTQEVSRNALVTCLPLRNEFQKSLQNTARCEWPARILSSILLQFSPTYRIDLFQNTYDGSKSLGDVTSLSSGILVPHSLSRKPIQIDEHRESE